MTEPIAILCPGQGAQGVGMGRSWVEASAEAAAVMERADAFVGDRFGASLSELCFSGPGETLNRTDVSQPAIFAVSVASFAGLCAGWGVSAPEVKLSAAAGLSLGEYTALHLAGVFGFEEGLELVCLRGRAMQDAAEATESGMMAVIGIDEVQAEGIAAEAGAAGASGGGGGVLVAANFNAPGQVVLSGDLEAIGRAETLAGAKGFKTARLPVAGAFHSPLMKPAAERLMRALQGTEMRMPRAPVYCNVTGSPHDPDVGLIRLRLAEQLTAPVRWSDCCSALAGAVSGGVHELAPGKSLAGLFRRIDRSVKVVSHDGPG
ncbi:MAG: ACP S-malonyltransferase [Phycisphaerales bacterium]|nr:ACP S-malonyltransferase [Phycisphaerales bacterium]